MAYIKSLQNLDLEGDLQQQINMKDSTFSVAFLITMCMTKGIKDMNHLT